MTTVARQKADVDPDDVVLMLHQSRRLRSQCITTLGGFIALLG